MKFFRRNEDEYIDPDVNYGRFLNEQAAAGMPPDDAREERLTRLVVETVDHLESPETKQWIRRNVYPSVGISETDALLGQHEASVDIGQIVTASEGLIVERDELHIVKALEWFRRGQEEWHGDHYRAVDETEALMSAIQKLTY